MTTTTRLTPATVDRMAKAGYEQYHGAYPARTWASAIKSVRDVWTNIAGGVARDEVDTPHQLYEAFRAGREIGEWAGNYSPMGRRWGQVLSAMRIARTEGME